jgi:uncharacterized protein
MLSVAPLLGAIVGLALALTGAGGGILAVPLLTFALHLSLATAGPVALVAVGLSAAVGAVMGLREGKVRYRAALLIGGVGMALAPLGCALAHRLPEWALNLGLALAMACTAFAMHRRSHASQVDRPKGSGRCLPCSRNPRSGRFIWTWPCAAVMSGIGMLSGLLNGLLGVGGGFVVVPSLSRYSDLTMHSIVCTSQAVIAMVSLSSVAFAASRGTLPWEVATPFAAGAVLALLIARGVANRVPTRWLQRNFAYLSAAVALALLVRGLGACLA